MSYATALMPTLLLLGTFFVVSPWLDPKRDAVRRTWRVLSILLLARYGLWRVTSTLPSPELSLTFFYQALFLIVEAAMIYLMIINRLRSGPTRSRVRDADAAQGWWRPHETAPLIDVFIPTYNESRSILERTLTAARRFDYPAYRVWILDDGGRDWLRSWADEMGVGYLRRSSNAFYKAGNLNAALEHVLALDTPPDFVAVLDADFVARSSFLGRALSLMRESKTAIVQTPQRFYNPDPFQYAFAGYEAWPDEQRIFFDFKLPMLEAAGIPTCCGTSFLVRVAALREIGGFPTESVSEDTLMSIKLQGSGWRTVYLDEPLSFGLNPDGLREYLTQRSRWALGSVQIVMGKWGPLGKSPGWYQKLVAYREACTWGSFCAFVAVSVLMVIVYWWTGTYGIKASAADVIYYGAPLWIDRFLLYWLSRGAFIPIVTQGMELVTGFAVIPSTWRALRHPGEHPFVVTAKGARRDRVVVHWNLLVPISIALALLVGGIAFGITGPYSPVRGDPLLGVATVVSIESVLILLVAAMPCIERPKYRGDERFPTSERAVLTIAGKAHSVELVDLSSSGAGLRADAHPEVGSVCTVDLQGVGEVRSEVVRLIGQHGLGMRFLPSPEQRELLILKVYCSGRYVASPEAWTFSQSMWSLARRVFG